MALLITEFVMGIENKVQASNPGGDHVTSECLLKHRLGGILIQKEKSSVKLVIKKLVCFGVNWMPLAWIYWKKNWWGQGWSGWVWWCLWVGNLWLSFLLQVLKSGCNALTGDVVVQAVLGCGSMNGANLGCFVLPSPWKKSSAFCVRKGWGSFLCRVIILQESWKQKICQSWGLFHVLLAQESKSTEFRIVVSVQPLCAAGLPKLCS